MSSPLDIQPATPIHHRDSSDADSAKKSAAAYIAVEDVNVRDADNGLADLGYVPQLKRVGCLYRLTKNTIDVDQRTGVNSRSRPCCSPVSGAIWLKKLMY